MSMHNRERRAIRKKQKAGASLTLVEKVKIGRHAARRSTAPIIAFLESPGLHRHPILRNWQHRVLASIGMVS
jgi:hypothetical protein